MAPHRCNYCLKPIATEAGIKQHIVQTPACRDQWTKLLDRMEHTVLSDIGNQLPERAIDNAPDYPYKWDAPDNLLDMLDGHLVHQSHVDVDPGPPDLCKLPSKHARVEEDNGDSPCWLSSGHFTEQYLGVATTVLGKKKTVFESLEAAEIERGDSEWAPFHDEDKWELGQFMMKNLGQTKINELLKLSSVSD